MGNCEGNYQGGGDSPGLASVGSESVLGDDDNNNNNSGNKNNNGRGKARGQAQGEDSMGSDADIESLSERLGNLDVDFEKVAELENDEMHVLSVLLKDVHVRGELVDTRDVYVIQYTMAPGLVWDSVNVEVDREDGNLVRFQGDMHFNLSDGWNRIKNDWKTAEGMPMAKRIAAAFDHIAREECVPDSSPMHRHITQTDTWPDGGNSRPEIVDPFKLHLRSRPTRHGTSFLETGKVKLRGVTPLTVIEANTVTAFFFADAPLLLNTTGGRGLKTAVSSDDESTPRRTGEGTSPFGDVFGDKEKKRRFF